VGELARVHTEHAGGGGDPVAPRLVGHRDDLAGVEVVRVLGKAGGGGVLDPLVDREKGEVPGPGETAGIVHTLQVHQYLSVPVGVDERPVDEVRPRQVEAVAGDPLALVVEETFAIACEELGYMLVHRSGR
jgi:hypothetical protein